MVQELSRSTAAASAGAPTRREIREAERRAALAAQATESSQTATPHIGTTEASDIAPAAPLAFASRRARRTAELGPQAAEVRAAASPDAPVATNAPAPVASAPVAPAPVVKASLVDVAAATPAPLTRRAARTATPATTPAKSSAPIPAAPVAPVAGAPSLVEHAATSRRAVRRAAAAKAAAAVETIATSPVAQINPVVERRPAAETAVTPSTEAKPAVDSEPAVATSEVEAEVASAPAARIAPASPAKVAGARTMPAVVIPAAVTAMPAITPVAELEPALDTEAEVADVEIPLSFRRNQAALRPVKTARTGSRRAYVRVKRELGARTRRGAVLRGAAGATALGFAATVAVATTLPAVANDPEAESAEAANAALVAAGGPQSLTVDADEAEVETASAGDQGHESAYGVSTMGSATAYNVMFGIPRPDPSAYSNNLTAQVQWPFPEGVVISDYFGQRPAPCSGCSSDHKGVDFTPGEGTPIGSIAAGTVVTAHEADNGGLGVYVEVEHIIDGERITSVYGHMQTGSITVKVGDVVQVGDEVGKVGNTGSSTGAHLHLEIHVNGEKVDPFAYLEKHNVPETVVVRPGESVDA